MTAAKEPSLADVMLAMSNMLEAQDKRHTEAMQAQDRRHAETLDAVRKQIEALSGGGVGVGTSQHMVQTDCVAARTAERLATLSQRIKQKFDADCEGVYAFSVWYGRYRELFQVDGADLDDKAKVRLLLEQLSDSVHENYKRQLMPDDPYAVGFDETIEKLKELYDTDVSSFTLRYQCLKLEKSCDETLLDYTGRVNEACERSEVHKMRPDDIKCLLWIFGLKSESDRDLCQRLLAFMDKHRKAGTDVTLQAVQKEAVRYITIRKESEMIGNDSVQVSKVHAKRHQNPTSSSANPTLFNSSTRPEKPQCYGCGSTAHRRANCEFRDYVCGHCGKIGHVDSYCRSKRNVSHDMSAMNEVSPQGQARIHAVRVPGKSDPDMQVSVRIQDTDVNMYLDIGSDVTLLNKDDFARLSNVSVLKSDRELLNLMGKRIPNAGMINCEFQLGSEKFTGKAYLTPYHSVLGLEWLRQSAAMRKSLKEMTSVETATTTSTSYASVVKGEETLGTSIRRSRNSYRRAVTPFPGRLHRPSTPTIKPKDNALVQE
jgi:hypothetical protein